MNLNFAINSVKKSKNKFNTIGKTRKIKLSKKLDKSKSKTEKPIKKKQSNDNTKNLLNNNNLEDITFKEIDGRIGIREPIYCFCNYVSYGDMVKCDNPKVI